MVIPSDLHFTKEDFERFKEWIALDIESLTWQGKFRSDFDKFWNCFFVEGLSLSQLVDRFKYAHHESGIGPLQAWFKWMFDKLIYEFRIFRRKRV